MKLWFLALALLASACSKKKDEPKANDGDQVDLPSAEDRTPRRRQYPPPPDVAGVPDDAEKSPGGVPYKLLGKTGTSNDRPGRNDTVTVHYTAWKTSGETYFSTRDRDKPQQMQLGTVGVGWGEALGMMTVGETRRLWLTPEQAYTPRLGSRAPRELMVYEVELVAIAHAPEVPADVAAPPADAVKTPSGLAYKLLSPGKGTDKPAAHDRVEIHFTGWTPEGRMVDSTLVRKRPRSGPLFKEMPGWVEGVQTMTAGEKKRFWIPESLTAGTGKKTGPLVFDLELVGFTRQPAPPPAPPDVARPPASGEKTPKGVIIRRLSGKRGTPVKAGDTITLTYTGWTSDGVMFDSSIPDGQPRTFVVGRGMPGWTEALTRMSPGEKVRLWIPEDQAFRGRTGPRGTLCYDMELHGVKEVPRPPPAPDDVAGPPAGAQRSPKGVAYVVLKPGTGTEHPKPTSTVIANYTGWTTDGKMFDSSIPKGKPQMFSLQRVIPGWQEAIPLMVVGEKTRFWIPKELAYPDDAVGRPHGMLVFDIELVEIK
jgi:FKBP-type peptidyl-prolyl cis-trans isomerase